jgi:hypothetical protein
MVQGEAVLECGLAHAPQVTLWRDAPLPEPLALRSLLRWAQRSFRD